MNMNKRAESDETDERVIRKKIKGLGKSRREKSELFFDDASVDEEDEKGRQRSGRGGVVLVVNSGVLREELGGEIVVGDG